MSSLTINTSDRQEAFSSASNPRALNMYEGYSHVTWYVGNAKQAASYYVTRMGFTHIAYRGLETGSRNIAAHVVGNGKIRFVFMSALRSEARVEKKSKNDNSIGVSGYCSDEDLIKEMNQHLIKHGDGVKDVAFSVNDLDSVFDSAIKNGAKVVAKPFTMNDEHGYIRQAIIQTYGDTTHTLIQHTAKNSNKPSYHGAFLPGFSNSLYGKDDPINDLLPRVDLNRIDHCVGNQGWNAMEDACRYYERVLGFHRFWSVDDKQIHTEYSALRSVVMASGGDDLIKMPINEPAEGKGKSQIEEFVEYYDGAGVQHLALHTHDIIKVIASMRQRGMDFIKVPKSYYLILRGRLEEKGVFPDSRIQQNSHMSSSGLLLEGIAPGNEDDDDEKSNSGSGHTSRAGSSASSVRTEDTSLTEDSDNENIEVQDANKYTTVARTGRYSYTFTESLDELEKLNILVDFDENGYLLQTFTKPLMDRPTVFVEIIQRMNHQGFGAGNFKALFEAIENDQRVRGNL